MSTCTGCGHQRFTRPVRIFPSSCEYVTIDLCLWCRVNWRDDRWAELFTTLLHHRHAVARRLAERAVEAR